MLKLTALSGFMWGLGNKLITPGLYVDEDIFHVPNVGMPITWNAASVAAVTLSGGNLIATNTGTTSSNQGAHASAALNLKSTGMIYWEETFTTFIAGANIGVGLGTSTSSYTNMGNSATTGIMCYRSGEIYANGSNTLKTVGARASGDTIGIACDLDARLGWFKKVNGTPGDWNGDAAANPATGVGGVTIPSPGGGMMPFCTFGGSGGVANNVITLNSGNSAFVGTAPSGYAPGWFS